jgi:hypothetical protein
MRIAVGGVLIAKLNQDPHPSLMPSIVNMFYKEAKKAYNAHLANCTLEEHHEEGGYYKYNFPTGPRVGMALPIVDTLPTHIIEVLLHLLCMFKLCILFFGSSTLCFVLHLLYFYFRSVYR